MPQIKRRLYFYYIRVLFIKLLMNENLKNVNSFGDIGQLLKFANSEYNSKRINRAEYLKILISCQSDTDKIRRESSVIANQIKIPFNF